MKVQAEVTVYEAKIIYADNSGAVVERSTPLGVFAGRDAALKRMSQHVGHHITEFDRMRTVPGLVYRIDQGIRSGVIVEHVL